MDAKKPFLVVFIVNSIYAGMFMLSKAALNGGMNPFVFIFYRQFLAAIFLTPIAIILEWKKIPPFSFIVLFKIFMLALIGITTSLNANTLAIDYTTATVASATSNSVPVFTFFLAVILRSEKLKLKSLPGIIKLIGVTLCLSGVLILAFYQGPKLAIHLFHNHLQHSPVGVQNHSKATWIKGTFLMITSNMTWSLWIVLQGKLLVDYPSKLLFTALQCCFSAIQSFCITAAVERDFSKWKLGFDVGLIAVAYSGIFVTGISFYLQAWCIEKKGPVFFAMSTPLTFVITITFSTLFLRYVTSLGSVLGGALIVGGLYSVLWGKSKENSDEKLPVGGIQETSVKAKDISNNSWKRRWTMGSWVSCIFL